jgi:hypothetical protein
MTMIAGIVHGVRSQYETRFHAAQPGKQLRWLPRAGFNPGATLTIDGAGAAGTVINFAACGTGQVT